MCRQKKRLLLKIFIGVFVFATFNVASYAYIWANYSECGFEGPCERSLSYNLSIGDYIVESAGYFLKSHSDILLFLESVEMSEMNGIDYKELRTIIYGAIENMEKAKESCFNLKQKADATPYNQNVINLLLSFDYNAFQEERGLNIDIFKDVERFLVKGDVRGIYGLLLENSCEILDKLYAIKDFVDADTLPDISMLWRVNQDYMENLFLGQYAAEVFKLAISVDKNIANKIEFKK